MKTKVRARGVEMVKRMDTTGRPAGRVGAIAGLAVALLLAACSAVPTDDEVPRTGYDTVPRAKLVTELAELNDGPCRAGQEYVQEDLRQPVRIAPGDGTLDTELVVRIRERCVPVWVKPRWEMQTLKLRTYGFPRDPRRPITDADADDPSSRHVAWSAPGPTFVLHPASRPGAGDGTRFKMKLYNRMPHDGDPSACVPNLKCNTSGPNAGVDPATGKCKEPIDPSQGGFVPQVPSQTIHVGGHDRVTEPPNCFHGNNSTNFHFHGFHVSPQLGQDNVGLELRPPLPKGTREEAMPKHGTHGEHGTVRYGRFDFDVDPLRYTQPPGTHWYHAHKHGSTALQVLNGLVGTFEIRGEFDEQLEEYFETEGGGELVDRLMVVQQLQEELPGAGGADQTGAVLVNGQANPVVRMARGEVQRWRFIGATMQASALLRVGFPDDPAREEPEVRQIAMDGVQFSPDNYQCQPFLNNPDCSEQEDKTTFNELTDMTLSPGNRVDLLVRAPDEAGRHCLVYDVVADLGDAVDANLREEIADRAEQASGTCGLSGGLSPLFTLVVEDEDKPMSLPTRDQFPAMASYLADIPPVSDPKLHLDVFYQMVQQTDLPGAQFWITQQKYDPSCANETLILDEPQRWTLWNNSFGVSHPFHIHQNPFQLLAESSRNPNEYAFPVWRDTLAIPTATRGSAQGFALPANSDPEDATNPWGSAVLRYVAKEFTGGFVNHCHILGHEDRGMMHNTQSSCADGRWATTGPVPPGSRCDAEGFCASDCDTGRRIPAMELCPEAPPQQSDWLEIYGVTSAAPSP